MHTKTISTIRFLALLSAWIVFRLYVCSLIESLNIFYQYYVFTAFVNWIVIYGIYKWICVNIWNSKVGSNHQVPKILKLKCLKIELVGCQECWQCKNWANDSFTKIIPCVTKCIAKFNHHLHFSFQRILRRFTIITVER